MRANKHTQNQLLYTHIHAARDYNNTEEFHTKTKTITEKLLYTHLNARDSNHGKHEKHGRISYENDNEKNSTPDYICALQILRLKAC